jgi:hypothetical protein
MSDIDEHAYGRATKQASNSSTDHGGGKRRAGIKTTDLDQSARLVGADDTAMEWQPIATAPFDRDLELAVINYDGAHALVFPCRRILGGWMKAENKKPVTVCPTHWREWQQAKSVSG